MDIDEQTEQARQRALHLAAEVAETEDSNVPVLLLQLKGTLLHLGDKTLSDLFGCQLGCRGQPERVVVIKNKIYDLRPPIHTNPDQFENSTPVWPSIHTETVLEHQKQNFLKTLSEWIGGSYQFSTRARTSDFPPARKVKQIWQRSALFAKSYFAHFEKKFVFTQDCITKKVLSYFEIWKKSASGAQCLCFTYKFASVLWSIISRSGLRNYKHVQGVPM